MHEWSDQAIPRLTGGCHIEAMFRHPLQVLDGYEVIGQPVVGSTGLTYVPWIDQAVRPYQATQLPNCTVVGLWDALRQAELLA